MAQKLIPQLQPILAVSDSVNIPVDDGIQTYRMTALQMKNYVLSLGVITKAMLSAAVQDLLVPTGQVSAYGGSITAPNGWLMCDGSAISRTTYADLFTAIGTTFGSGNGSTTFNLPDFRGRFLRGVNDGSGRDPDAASRTAMATGGLTGDNVGSVQGHAFQTHTHSQNAHGHSIQDSGTGGSAARVNVVALDRLYGGTGSTNYSLGAVATTATNNNATASGTHAQATANETRPVNAAVRFMIKY